MHPITEATQDYIHIFSGYLSTFLHWGQTLFFILLGINLSILFLWYAFDGESFAGNVGKFIRKFFVISLFYTLMLNHQWLISLLDSATSMGKTITGTDIDPTSIVANGISIANNLWSSVKSFNPFTITSGALLLIITYVVIIFSFISIALQLAVTLIITQLLISLSTFFLGFAALGATTQIARNTLDLILANCVKLLGIYLVVGASSQVISIIENTIQAQYDSTDMYWWLLSAVLLFWLLAKNVPEQLAKLVSNVIQDTQGHSAAAMASTAIQTASLAAGGIQVAGAAASTIAGHAAKATGSSVLSAASHFMEAKNQGMGLARSSVKAGMGMAGDALKSGHGVVSDHYQSLKSKSTGGEGAKNIPGFSQRMHQLAKNRMNPPSKDGDKK